MKVTILQEKLKEGLISVEKITGKESTLPILNNILIKAEKNSLDIIATNLETGVLWRILAKTEEEGMVVLPAQIISGFVGGLPNKSIEIKSNNSSVEIVSEKSRSIIKGFNPEEFPILPLNTEGESITINARVFCEALAQVANFTSISSVKPEISGVYLLFKKDLIKIVATDSFRLGERIINLQKNQPLSKDYPLILPQRAIKEVIGIFSDLSENIKIFFAPNQVTIESESEAPGGAKVQYVSRLIEGEFPSYEEIIPTEYKTTIRLSRKDFINQIKSASLFGGKINEVVLKIDAKKEALRIYSQSSELGEYDSEIKPAELKGEDMTISFNHRFLTDGLAVIKGDDCIFQFSSEDGAGVLKPASASNFLYILMPIKKN